MFQLSDPSQQLIDPLMMSQACPDIFHREDHAGNFVFNKFISGIKRSSKT